MEQRRVFVNSYTVLLFVCFALFLSAAVVSVWLSLTRVKELRDILWFVAALEVLVAFQCCALAVGRACGARWAAPATAALNVLLVLWFPGGTALAAWWYFSIRPRERPAGETS
jgi:hypothetical protein